MKKITAIICHTVYAILAFFLGLFITKAALDNPNPLAHLGLLLFSIPPYVAGIHAVIKILFPEERKTEK